MFSKFVRQTFFIFYKKISYTILNSALLLLAILFFLSSFYCLHTGHERQDIKHPRISGDTDRIVLQSKLGPLRINYQSEKTDTDRAAYLLKRPEKLFIEESVTEVNILDGILNLKVKTVNEIKLW